MGKIGKYLSLGCLALMCNACSGVDYVNNAGYTEITGIDVNDKAAYFDTSKRAKQYGALMFKRDSNKEMSEEGNAITFALKRQKQKFFAETSLFETKNEEKTFIDKTFFDFGLDRKSKGLSLGLTMNF